MSLYSRNNSGVFCQDSSHPTQSLAYVANVETCKVVRTPQRSCSPTCSYCFLLEPLRHNHYFHFFYSLVFPVLELHEMESYVCTLSHRVSLSTCLWDSSGLVHVLMACSFLFLYRHLGHLQFILVQTSLFPPGTSMTHILESHMFLRLCSFHFFFSLSLF